MQLTQYITNLFKVKKPENKNSSTSISNLNANVSDYLWSEDAQAMTKDARFGHAVEFCRKWSDKAWVNGGITWNKEAIEQRVGTEQAIGLAASSFSGTLNDINNIAANADLYIMTSEQFRQNYYDTVSGSCKLKDDFVNGLKPYTRENLAKVLKSYHPNDLEVGVIRKQKDGFVSEGYPNKLEYLERKMITDTYAELVQTIRDYVERHGENADSTITLINQKLLGSANYSLSK